MKKIIVLVNILILLVIPAVVVRTEALQNDQIDTLQEIRYVNSSVLPVKKVVKEEKKNSQKDVKENKEKKVSTVTTKEPTKIEPKKEEVKPTPPPTPPKPDPKPDVIRTLKGSLSGYGPDCKGCSGKTSTGWDLRNGNIYYPDTKYGRVRIVAADRSIPFGSMVRVKNSKIGTFLAIVLDRGSGVGIGKKHLFDLAFESESKAAAFMVSYNVTFEIIREGYK